MKASQFSSEQIIRILEQAERGEQTISAICREHHIAETTFYRWASSLAA
jgi:putative transposase